MKKTLVAGWFSFEQMGATAGDLMARDVACSWLKQAGHTCDVALAPPFAGGVDWTKVDPRQYSDVVFVCGPFGNGWPVPDFLARFAGCRLVGLDLTMLEPLNVWNPFDLLWERDSSVRARPDISVVSTQAKVPVVGMVLIDTPPKCHERDSRVRAHSALRHLAAERGVTVVNIDTRLDTNTTGLHTAAQIESLISRMDTVLTTRLHGIVLAIKNGVPALAIDSVLGGGKVRRQAGAIGWPCVLPVEEVTESALQEAFCYCLSEEGRGKATQCAREAQKLVGQVRDEFVAVLSRSQGPGPFSPPAM